MQGKPLLDGVPEKDEIICDTLFPYNHTPMRPTPFFMALRAKTSAP